MNSWQETQMQSLLGATNDSEFLTALTRAARDLGFENCAYGMRAALPVSNPKVVMLSNYPTEWQALYTKRNYLAVDPTVSHGMKSNLPLVWSDKLFDSCHSFWEEARSYGLRVGWAQACHDARGIGGLLTFSRSHDELSFSELQANIMKMTWLAQLTYEAVARILVDKLVPEHPVLLTNREAEIMRWTADGKTSGEISTIMNISESTVNFHVNNAVEKLQTTNKTAAAIKATMLRLV